MILYGQMISYFRLCTFRLILIRQRKNMENVRQAKHTRATSFDQVKRWMDFLSVYKFLINFYKDENILHMLQ